MNILLITTHLKPGGISHYIVSLAKSLKEKGHNVYVASAKGDFTEILNDSKVEHIELNILTKSEISPKILFLILKIKKIVKEKNIQIIHAQTRVTQVLSFLLSKLTAVPYISTCHGFFRPHLFRRIFPLWGKKVIAISEAVRLHLISDMRIKEGSIRLVHNGIDCDKFFVKDLHKINEFKEKNGIKNGPVVGILARLSTVKGHKYLIEAFKEVMEHIPTAQLLIVGDGKIKDELVGLSRNLNIEENVFFVSSVLDISLVLSAMDVFVMPSLQEGLGLAIMQAQAAGLAVIGSSVGGINTLIKDRQTGILIPPAGVGDISKSIILLLTDKDLSKRLGENARRNIKENFSLEKMTSQTEKVYNEEIS